MSMVLTLKQIASARLQELFNNPDLIEEMIFNEEENDDSLYLDKAWHGIHFLLNDDAWGGKEPLKYVIMGRGEIGGDIGYGPAHYLTAQDVKAVANALSDISAEQLRSKFDADNMTEADIYPSIWSGDEDLDYLMEYYELLVEYYIDAAQKGNAMLIYFT